MGFLATLNHLMNFLAPALWLALLLPVLSRLVLRKRASASAAMQMLLQLALGSLVLVAGLLLTGHDGKMLTYLALVLVAASVQWLLSRR